MKDLVPNPELRVRPKVSQRKLFETIHHPLKRNPSFCRYPIFLHITGVLRKRCLSVSLGGLGPTYNGAVPKARMRRLRAWDRLVDCDNSGKPKRHGESPRRICWAPPGWGRRPTARTRARRPVHGSGEGWAAGPGRPDFAWIRSSARADCIFAKATSPEARREAEGEPSAAPGNVFSGRRRGHF
jgi:hypothetical protein